jgi:hypothetical protein
MKLSDFEQYFDDRILQRGLDYFHSGNVSSLKTTDGSHYTAEVDGTDVYTVEVVINHFEEIVDTYCDCPYDLGEFCKHQAAVLFALKNDDFKNVKTITPLQDKKQDLRSVLLNLKKEDLVHIILDFSKEDRNIEKRLLFQYAQAKDEISSSKKLIKEYIYKAKRRGFIEWNQVDYALQGAELVLQKAQKKIELGETETAVSLAIAVLTNAIDMIDFSDDSSGSIGMVISESLTTIDEAIRSHIDHLNVTEQKKLFEMIVKEALNGRYNGWSEWRIDLLRTCIYFCKSRDLRAKLESQLDILINQSANGSWSSEYESSELKTLQLEIIEQCDETEKAEMFIYENIHHSKFREKAIILELKKGEFDQVISLCLEGEEDRQWPGLVKKWREYRYQTYEYLGDVEKQRELAKELLYGNDFKYYSKLKKLYSENKWEEVLDEIVAEFQKQPYQVDAYLSILKAENLSKQILEYCNSRISNITKLYPYLIECYFDEVNRLFITYIQKATEEASDRKKYKNICALIKTYKKACGSIHSQKLIVELKERYKRRPAFIDELEKI